MENSEKKIYNQLLTQLSEKQFSQYVLPYLQEGKRGPQPKLPLYKFFNYILKVLYQGCQWKECPIEKDATGKAEIHYSRVFRKFAYWRKERSFEELFTQLVVHLQAEGLLQTSLLHLDGTNIKKAGIW